MSRLVYLCPYCGSEDIKLTKNDPIYIDTHDVSHTLGVIEKYIREERYVCRSCGALFEASTSKFHFSLLTFIKVWGGPIVLMVLTIIFAQFWGTTTYEDGRTELNNWESFLALVCGTLCSTWVIFVVVLSLGDD